MLKSLNSDSAIPTFSGNRKDNGSIDLIFDSYAKAQEARLSLVSKLNSIDVYAVVPVLSTKWNVVGIPYEMSLNEAADSLVKSNRSIGFKRCTEIDKFDNAISLTGCETALMQVIAVRKCRKGQLRIVVATNDVMNDAIKDLKLKVGNMICRKYIVTHDRCFNCHAKGHFASECKHDSVCAICSGNHKSWACTASQPTCINCVRSKRLDVHHPVYSSACPDNS